MRDFDKELPTEEERIFRVGGETLTFQLISGEALAVYEDADLPETGHAGIERMNERIGVMLNDTDRAKWEQLVADGKIPFRMLTELNRWATELQTGRPTQAPESLPLGPGATERTSTPRSSRRAGGSRA